MASKGKKEERDGRGGERTDRQTDRQHVNGRDECEREGGKGNRV